MHGFLNELKQGFQSGACCRCQLLGVLGWFFWPFGSGQLSNGQTTTTGTMQNTPAKKISHIPSSDFGCFLIEIMEFTSLFRDEIGNGR